MTLVTVQISTDLILGTPLSTVLLFSPLSTPVVIGGSLVPTAAQRKVTQPDGTASIDLISGTYWVTFPAIIGNTDVVTIEVPEGEDRDETIDLVDIITAVNRRPVPLPSATVIASQAEAEAGTSNVKAMTPLRVKQSITANAAAQSVAGQYRLTTSGLMLYNADTGLYHSLTLSGAEGAELLSVGIGQA